jgi:sulfate adenylyltransferase subunit 1
MSALRLLTAGSVDDGKSTLIGRLLYDSRAILVDQAQDLRQRATPRALPTGGPDFDLSLLTDGLQAEREQGITIDVAWRSFASDRRKFILADTPGHEQYTRNMVTAATAVDAAVVLVDATKLDLGAELPKLLPQTHRHALLAQLLRVPHIVFAVNKLDAVVDAALAFRRISAALQRFAAAAGIVPAGILPVSALRGDNVSSVVPGFAGYVGPSLLALLEGLPASHRDAGLQTASFLAPVQYLSLQGSGANPQRVLWGRIAEGAVAEGDVVQHWPSGQQARVLALRHHDQGQASQRGVGQSVGLVLDRDIDVSRGDWLAAPGGLPSLTSLSATAAWFDPKPAQAGRWLRLRHGHRWLRGRISRVLQRVDIGTLQAAPADRLHANDIGRLELELSEPLPVQPYARSRAAGALLAVDPASHGTAAALLVEQTEPEVLA